MLLVQLNPYSSRGDTVQFLFINKYDCIIKQISHENNGCVIYKISWFYVILNLSNSCNQFHKKLLKNSLKKSADVRA